MHKIILFCLISIVSSSVLAATGAPSQAEFERGLADTVRGIIQDPGKRYVDEALASSGDPLVQLTLKDAEIMTDYFRTKSLSRLSSLGNLETESLKDIIKDLCLNAQELQFSMDKKTCAKHPEFRRVGFPEALMRKMKEEQLENRRVVGGLLVMRAAGGGLPRDTITAPDGWVMVHGHWKPVDAAPVVPPASASAAAGSGAGAASASAPAEPLIDPESTALLSQLLNAVPLTPSFLADFRTMHRLHARIVRESYWYCRKLAAFETGIQIKDLQNALEAMPTLGDANVAECNGKIEEIERLMPKLKVYQAELEKLETEIEALKTAPASDTVESVLRQSKLDLELRARQQHERFVAYKGAIGGLLAPFLAARAVAFPAPDAASAGGSSISSSAPTAGAGEASVGTGSASE